MTHMAGFDAVVELLPSALRKIFQNEVTVPGGPGRPDVPIVPGAELERTILYDGFDVMVHVIVDDDPTVTVDRAGDGTPLLSISIPFIDSSIAGTVNGTTVEARALAGEIVMTGPVETVRDGNLVVQFDLGGADTEVQFDAASERRFEDALDDTPIPPDRASDALGNLVGDEFGGVTELAKYPLTSDCGSLNPVRVRDGNVAAITDPTGDVQVLGFFLSLLPDGGRDPDDRDEGTVVPLDQDYAVSISPEAFRRLQFCPMLPEELAPEEDPPSSMPCTPEDLPNMPAPCGEADSTDLPGNRGRITRLDAQFEDGNIAIVGDFADDGTCYEATGQFRNEITLSVAEDGSGLVSEVSETDVDTDIDIDWWCRFGAFMIADAFGLVGTAIGEAVAEDIITDMIGEGLEDMAGGDGFDSPAGLTIESVTVSEDALQVSGFTDDPPADIDRAVSVTCSGEETDVSEEVRTVEAEPPCETLTSGGASPDYDVTFMSVTHTFTCTATGSGYGRPFQWDLRERLDDDPVPLEGDEGTVTLEVRQKFPSPYPEGEVVRGEVDIEYRRRGNVLELQNDPEDGNYSVWLTVTGTETDPGSGPGTYTRVEMEGRVAHSADYTSDMEDCATAAGRAPGMGDDEDGDGDGEGEQEEHRRLPHISPLWVDFEDLAEAERERLFRDTVLSDEPGIGPFMSAMSPLLDLQDIGVRDRPPTQDPDEPL